ncbi:MAG TPA: glucose 1-dehydrogenase [Methanocella sp.]|jgi:NAD(P)-dependent dehydrogenase (short-subunit alcohol dehydrogenase family)
MSGSDPCHPLKGRVAVVTGASGDLGFAMSKALFDAGATVVLAARDEANLKKAAEALGDSRRATAIVADVADDAQIKALMKKVYEAHGRIDILLTAAGIQVRKPFLELTRADWECVLKVNLSGTFFCCQEAAKYMIPQGKGKIIMITSLTAEIGLPNMAPYVASRGAIKQLSKALAVELAPHGINVNCLGPGRFLTNMTRDLYTDEKVRESFLRLIPMKKAGEPSDLAGAVVFLASDASDYMTGQSIYIDGGWLAGGGNTLG